jgi:hypothetical protein
MNRLYMQKSNQKDFGHIFRAAGNDIKVSESLTDWTAYKRAR